MKPVLLTCLFLSSFAFSAPPTPASFGAFTYKNYLYITFLGDCNTKSVDVRVGSLCNKDRMTRNYAYVCDTELVVGATRMICPDQFIEPKVYTFDLANLPVAKESRYMVIKYNNESVKVKLNRE